MKPKLKGKKEEEQMLTCDFCGKRNKTVVLSVDPYAQEIYDDDTEYNICDDCYQESADEI